MNMPNIINAAIKRVKCRGPDLVSSLSNPSPDYHFVQNAATLTTLIVTNQLDDQFFFGP